MAAKKKQLTNQEAIPSTLVIWEESPEKIRFFLIPNTLVTDELLQHLTSANGTLVNLVGDEVVLGLQSWLFDEEGETKHPELEVKSQKGILVFDGVIITRVCQTGFAL